MGCGVSTQNKFPPSNRQPQAFAASAVVCSGNAYLELDDLLRIGISQAQCASVARTRREREKHLGVSRELLIMALKRNRNGSNDPDIRDRILAVLSKLRWDACSSMGFKSHETPELFSSSSSPTESQDRQRRPAKLENTGDGFDLGHSTRAVDLKDVLFEYTPLLKEDSEETFLYTTEAQAFHNSLGDKYDTIKQIQFASHQENRVLIEPKAPSSASVGALHKDSRNFNSLRAPSISSPSNLFSLDAKDALIGA